MSERYRILEKLGGGGMGIVFKAEDTILGRFVALKFLAEHRADNPDALEQLRREARAASTLDHPNICTVYEIASHDGRLAIAMQWLEGATLKQKLRPGFPLPLDTTLDLGTQVADALTAAHAKGIVHRDIKPANLFVTVRGDVKVLDFGIARQVSDPDLKVDPEAPTAGSSSSGSLAGTMAYMSPEQALGMDLDARTDLFSLGAVLYQMITGRLPFAGRTAAAFHDALLHQVPVLPSHLNAQSPPELDRIILRALEKDKSLRYQSAADLEADLKRLKRDHEAGLRSIVVPRSRRPWLVAMIVALVVVAAALLIFRARRPPALTPKDALLITSFTNTSGDTSFDGALRTVLEVSLEQSPYFNVVSDQQIAQTLRLMEQPPDTVITPGIGRALCLRAQIKAMLRPQIASVGHQLVIILTAVEPATGAVLAQTQAVAPSTGQVIKALDHASRSLRAKLGESLASIQAFDQPLLEATTSSLPALRAVTLAEDELVNGNEQAAVAAARQAVALDPQFAMAWRELATAENNQGNAAAAMQAAQKAFDLRDRASEKEKLLIAASFYQYAGEAERCIQAWQTYTQTYPRAWRGLNNLAVAQNHLGQFQQALPSLLAAVAAQPGAFLPRENTAAAYVGLNELNRAQAVLEAAIALHLGDYSAHVQLGDVAWAQGDAAALARENAAASLSPQGRLEVLERQAGLAAMHGQFRRAHERYAQADALARQLGEDFETSRNLAAEGVESVLVGQPALAAAAAGAQSHNLENQFDAAYIYAWSGHPSAASALISSAAASAPRNTLTQMVWLPDVAMASALARNAPSGALQQAQVAAPYDGGTALSLLTRALVELGFGDPGTAAVLFRRVIALRAFVVFEGQDPTVVALAQLGLARADAQQHQSAQARAAYQDFFALWQHADAGLRLLARAKAEYARLH
ncbi:MAG: protein kinase domain-containing protein [Terriglobales bacterium]